MVYSERLANRVERALAGRPTVKAKKMFGGMGYFHRGHLLVAVWREALVARIGPDAYEAALREPYVAAFDVTGKPMKGWVLVAPEAIDTDNQLASWIDRAWRYVQELPEK
jgi:TfoX/Sxy family transcriptional regulator of competence genes